MQGGAPSWGERALNRRIDVIIDTREVLLIARSEAPVHARAMRSQARANRPWAASLVLGGRRMRPGPGRRVDPSRVLRSTLRDVQKRLMGS